MSNGANIDPVALADARERLHYAAESALDEERTNCRARASDLRLVLDALREADDRFIAISIQTFREARDCHITGAPTPDQVERFSALIRERVTGQRQPARNPRAAKEQA